MWSRQSGSGWRPPAARTLRSSRPRLARQLLERGRIDEIDLHIAPVLLGAGIRLFDNPGGGPIRLKLINGDDPSAAVNVRYHPVATQ
jgi:dihydrofolate reductase